MNYHTISSLRFEDTQLITIEFAPEKDGCQYSQPLFVFRDRVAIKDEWEYFRKKHLNLVARLNQYLISGMELNSSLKVTEPPAWKYGIRCSKGTKELVWFDESELILFPKINQ